MRYIELGRLVTVIEREQKATPERRGRPRRPLQGDQAYLCFAVLAWLDTQRFEVPRYVFRRRRLDVDEPAIAQSDAHFEQCAMALSQTDEGHCVQQLVAQDAAFNC